jgi:hypothetical protein
MQSTVKCNRPAGIAAAIAVFECQSKNIWSVKLMIVQKQVEITSGTASRNTSWPPQRRFHQ